jgi:hypothetical protein
VVASLPLAVVVGKEHNCTTAIVLVARTVVEGDTVALRVGYTTYGTLEKHR